MRRPRRCSSRPRARRPRTTSKGVSAEQLLRARGATLRVEDLRARGERRTPICYLQRPMYAFALVPFVLLATRPQDPPDVLATFKLEGKPATVTRNDVAIEMAFHLR